MAPRWPPVRPVPSCLVLVHPLRIPSVPDLSGPTYLNHGLCQISRGFVCLFFFQFLTLTFNFFFFSDLGLYIVVAVYKIQ